MDISRVIQSLQLDGEVLLECPKGSIQIHASKEDQIRIQFSNAPTFRYFLGSLPNSGASELRKQLRYAQQIPQALYVDIDGKPILEKPAGGKLKVHYRRVGQEWLRWKTGL